MNNVSQTNNQVTLGVTQISYSFNYSSLRSLIVDSGASEHIFISMRFFDDYKKIMLVNSILPNGHMSIEKKTRHCEIFIRADNS